MIVSISALILSSAVLYARRQIALKHAMVESATIDADMVGRNSTAAISFQNNEDAAEVLSALRADANIDAAWIFTPEGKLFAGYHKDEVVPPPDSRQVSLAATTWRDDDLRVFRRI